MASIYGCVFLLLAVFLAPHLISYAILILIAGILLGGRASLGWASICALSSLAMLYFTLTDRLVPSLIPDTPITTWIAQAAIFFVLSVLLYLATNNFSRTLERSRRNEQALALANQALNEEIDQRTQIEAELRDSEDRYRILSEATFEGIAITDQGKVVDMNSQFAPLYGYSEEEAIGMAGWEFVASESRELVKQNILSGYEHPYEALQLRKDGSVFPAYVSGRSIPYKGRTYRVTAIQDITEVKQAQAMLKEYSEQLEETVKARTAALKETQGTVSSTREAGRIGSTSWWCSP